jgi:hypothetical protein
MVLCMTQLIQIIYRLLTFNIITIVTGLTHFSLTISFDAPVAKWFCVRFVNL